MNLVGELSQAQTVGSLNFQADSISENRFDNQFRA
jgi:hypothetical protein